MKKKHDFFKGRNKKKESKLKANLSGRNWKALMH